MNKPPTQIRDFPFFGKSFNPNRTKFITKFRVKNKMSAQESQNQLSQNVLRLLHDKLYEKRKTAALEIEKIVRLMSTNGQHQDIHNTLDILSNEFALSNNPNSKKGGLIGLAACAIALGNVEIKPFLGELIKPVFVCSADQDSRIRYFACEALYNIVKVARANSIIYFNQLFNALSKITADPDVNVRKGAELLDRLLKDIILECSDFDISSLIPSLCELIYTNNPHTRNFIVQWITCLDNIPDIDIVIYLPKLLDGLFLILGDKSNEIQKICETAMGELLSSIQSKPKRADIDKMINIVVVHCQSKNDLIKSKALHWLNEFIALDGVTLVKYTSGVIEAVLPTLAYEDLSRNNVRESARIANQSLMKLIDESYNIKGDKSKLPINEMISVLIRHLKHHSTPTKIAVLRWFAHSLVKIPYLILPQVEQIFPHILDTLSDKSDEVVYLALECLAEIVSSPAGSPSKSSNHEYPSIPLEQNQYFEMFLTGLLKKFRENNTLLENRAIFILRQLSVLLNAEQLYNGLAKFLLQEDDCMFCAIMVQILNTILMTSVEFYDLRNYLKKSTAKESAELFTALHKSWSFDPIATVSLCLLTQNYKHCYTILMKFSDLDITVEFLRQTDKLIQLIESPIFTSLRLQLLDSNNNEYLSKCLYAILMLLPQTTSFHVLQRRLNCVPQHVTQPRRDSTQLSGNKHTNVDFDYLFNHFTKIQNKTSEYVNSKRKTL